jgi:hypothetical protein
VEIGWRGAEKQAVKDLFGRPLRVALAAWIIGREGEPFYLQQAQQAMAALGEAPSGVIKELRLLETNGMLSAFPDGRRVYFTPLPSRYWQAFHAIAKACGITTSVG